MPAEPICGQEPARLRPQWLQPMPRRRRPSCLGGGGGQAQRAGMGSTSSGDPGAAVHLDRQRGRPGIPGGGSSTPRLVRLVRRVWVGRGEGHTTRRRRARGIAGSRPKSPPLALGRGSRALPFDAPDVTLRTQDFAPELLYTPLFYACPTELLEIVHARFRAFLHDFTCTKLCEVLQSQLMIPRLHSC